MSPSDRLLTTELATLYGPSVQAAPRAVPVAAIGAAATGERTRATVCRLCGSSEIVSLGDARLDHLVRCGACGLVHVRDFPFAGDLQHVYGESYYRNTSSHVVGYEDYEADEANVLETAQRRLRQISRRKRAPGHLLDVGCAVGFFLEAARERGWQASGIELSSYAAERARTRVGCDVHCGELTDVRLPAGTFDVITLWDVVEHMADPLEQLTECRRIIKPDGLLALSTPDIGSLMAKLTGPRWMGFKLADEHLYYFSRATATELLDRAGFEVVQAFPVGKCIHVEFFVKRLGLYLPRLAGALMRLVRGTWLGERTIYVNPGDIICLVARPRPS